MKKKYLWAILAAAAVLILILFITLPKANSKGQTAQEAQPQTESAAAEPAEQAAEPEQEKEENSGTEPGELPLDTTQPKIVSAIPAEPSTQPAQQQEESAPAVDPATGMELDENELPLDEP